MWGIDPCAAAHRQDGSLGSPRSRRASHRHRAVSLESQVGRRSHQKLVSAPFY